MVIMLRQAVEWGNRVKAFFLSASREISLSTTVRSWLFVVSSPERFATREKLYQFRELRKLMRWNLLVQSKNDVSAWIFYDVRLMVALLLDI